MVGQTQATDLAPHGAFALRQVLYQDHQGRQVLVVIGGQGGHHLQEVGWLHIPDPYHHLLVRAGLQRQDVVRHFGANIPETEGQNGHGQHLWILFEITYNYDLRLDKTMWSVIMWKTFLIEKVKKVKDSTSGFCSRLHTWSGVQQTNVICHTAENVSDIKGQKVKVTT